MPPLGKCEEQTSETGEGISEMGFWVRDVKTDYVGCSLPFSASPQKSLFEAGTSSGAVHSFS